VIRQRFVPAILGDRFVSDAERLLLSLPGRHAGLAIDNLVLGSGLHHSTSERVSNSLVHQLLQQDHILDVNRDSRRKSKQSLALKKRKDAQILRQFNTFIFYLASRPKASDARSPGERSILYSNNDTFEEIWFQSFQIGIQRPSSYEQGRQKRGGQEGGHPPPPNKIIGGGKHMICLNIYIFLSVFIKLFLKYPKNLRLRRSFNICHVLYIVSWPFWGLLS
jgi:hypothetical protein